MSTITLNNAITSNALSNEGVKLSEARTNEILDLFKPQLTVSAPITLRGKSYNFPGVLPNNVYMKEVIYHKPATIVFWSDGTKTVCKCHDDDTYSEETGLAMCICKKMLGNKEFKRIFEAWLPEQKSLLSTKITLKDVMAKVKKNKR